MIARWRQQPVVVQDVVLAIVAGVAWFGFAAWSESGGWQPRDEAAHDLAGAATVVALAVRRLAPAPLLAAGVVVYALLYDQPLQTEFHLLPVLVVGYSAASRRTAQALLVAAAALGAGFALSSALLLRQVPRRGFDWSRILFDEFAVAGIVLLGAVTAAQRRTAASLALRNAELERLRAAEAERAVARERTRIARELHDDVAHHLTALVVRAQAVDRVAATRPELAVESAGWFAETARSALGSVRRTVAVLRDGEGPAELAPGPTIRDLVGVVARVEEAGVAVRLDVDELPPLRPEVEHATVRVVQEALTNVLRHAGARTASVSVRATTEGIAVTVEDDGTGPGPEQPRALGGFGLPGMRERAASCGGRFDLDRSGQLGGWRIRAWFPA